jgi:nucleoside-diphosphate-sugar epimerase
MESERTKIIILGSKGFLGSNLKYFFTKTVSCKNYNIIYSDRNTVDVLNEDELNNYIEKIQPNIIINCCGMVGSSEMNKNIDEDEIFNNNFVLNMNILNCCKKYNIQKLITFSSYRMFGENISNFYNEEDIHFNYKISYNAGYLLSKKMLDIQIQLLKKKYPLKIVCFILPNIFGYFDKFESNSRIVPALITKIEDAKKRNENLYLDSNSNNTVNLIYSEDIFNIVNKCIIDDIEGNIIVFNKNGIITLNDLTNKIAKFFNYKNNIFFKNDIVLNENNIMKPNLDKFNHFFKDFEFTDLDLGLKITTDFIKTLKF